MSNRCTCCHVCHTSVKTSKRSFFPCSVCPSIICRQCIELTNQNWDQVCSLKNWSCPRCNGNCPCKRCRAKVANGNLRSTDKQKLNKRKRSATIFEDNAFPNKIQKTSLNQSISDKKNIRTSKRIKQKKIASSSSPVIKSSPIVKSFPIIINSNSIDDKKQRITELCNKNQQCLDYISRTERLLQLIKTEQTRIQEELSSLSNSKIENNDLSSILFNETKDIDTNSDSDSDNSSNLSYDDDNSDLDLSQTLQKEKENSSILNEEQAMLV